MTKILAPISVGELIDKITILGIKLERIRADDQRRNVAHELDELMGVRAMARLDSPDLAGLEQELFQVNLRLWEVEDELRKRERERDFGASFVASARAVYDLNDRRSALKKQINQLSGSAIIEEKSYASGG
jgi:hypothetical protein